MRSYKDGSQLSVQYLEHQMEKSYLAPYLVIHRADLHNILLQEAERLDVHISLNCQISRINFTESSVKLSSGELISGDVIFGADGERSMCRDALFNHASSFQDSGDHCFRITVDGNEVAKHKGLADLVQPPSIKFWVGPGAHAMSYALKRDGLLNIVLTCKHDLSTTSQHGPLQADMAEVRQAFSHWDSKLQALLDIAKECSKWNLFEAPEASYWTHPDGKFTLLGDSAHAMLPFLYVNAMQPEPRKYTDVYTSGQGAAMAIEDAAVLGTLLSKMQHRAQIPDILSLYERLRKPRTKAIRDRARAIRKVYTLEDGPLQQERDRQLRELVPYDGCPNFLADPSLQRTLFGYDANDEAEKAWSIYLES